MAVGMRRVFVRAPWEQLEGTLMDAQTSPTTGQWLDPLSYYPLSITVSGVWTGTIFIVVSNDLVRPDESANPASFPVLGDPGGITSPIPITTNTPYKWIKAFSTDLSSTAGVTISFVSARPLGERAF